MIVSPTDYRPLDFYTAFVAAAVVAVAAAAAAAVAAAAAAVDCAYTAYAAATALVAVAAVVESTLFVDCRAVASVNSCSRTNLASYCTSS